MKDTAFEFEYDSDTTEKTSPTFTRNVKSSSFFIRISFRLSTQVINPHCHHIRLLLFLLEHVSTDLKMYNKRHKMLKEIAIASLNNEEMYNNHFNLHSINLRNKETKLYTVIQELKHFQSLDELKRVPGVLDYLKEEKLKLYNHDWQPHEWNNRTVGFMPQLPPSHYIKDMLTAVVDNNIAKIDHMPKIRIRTMMLNAPIQNTLIKVRVHAKEVQANDYEKANKLLFRHIQYPAEYVPFKTRGVNETAFFTSIAMAAQFQEDLHVIALKQVSKESYFILENEIKQMELVKGHHHNEKTGVMKLIVHKDHYKLIKHDIKKLLPRWIQHLDPSNTRTSGIQIITNDLSNNSSDDTVSQISVGIDSLLTMDMASFTIFPSTVFSHTKTARPVSNITMSTEEDRVKKQQVIIETQGQRIDELLQMIQEMKEATDTDRPTSKDGNYSHVH
jgi:hypothetical protein